MNQPFIDPNIDRKKEIVKKNVKILKGYPKPAIVEFNLSGLCNRTCEFCPRADPNVFPNTNEFFEISLYEKILSDLKGISYDSRIVFSAFSEPLLHKKLEAFISLSKKYLPSVGVEVVSNGDFVTPQRLKTLFEAGLNLISVSMYDGPQQIDKFLQMKEECHLRDDQFILRRRYFEDGNIGITLSNRAGLAKIEGFHSEVETDQPLPLKHPCFYPYYLSLIDHTGNMLLCTHDWSKSVVVGNLAEENFWDLWCSRRLDVIRESLGRGDRNFKPCDHCDVIGTLMGRENYLAWEEQYNATQ